ncbi:hypothetical protein [Candidatus Tisiphia endosymbiont of Parasteatoda lunata]|uniref:hypothetical protein n=1 Tax=Candidatus Tisiphia endosymbiont of Parasteatoda lunata TaxID=3066275 RepID=UPI00313EDE78
MIRYLKFMLKRRTASAGFFSQSGTIKLKTIFNFSANIRIFFVKILFNHRLWGALNIFGGRTLYL